MADPFAAADAAIFRLFGVAALWKAGGAGAGTACTAVRERPTLEADAFGSAMLADQQRVSVRKADIAVISKNDTITIGAEVLTVRSVRQDSQALMWICEC